MFIARFFLNLAVAIIIARIFYMAGGRGKREYLFTYLSTSTVVFLICILVSQVEVQLGIAIGLCAVFSIIRFRSVSATPRDLAYLFLCLGMGLILALLPPETPFLRILINFSIILATLGLMEFLVFRQGTVKKTIIYDRPDLLGSENRSALIADLQSRYGLKGIEKVQEGDIDSLKMKVKLRVQLKDPGKDHFEE